MRMWMIDPRLMCRRHLLGEHVELHMLVGCLQRGFSVDGYTSTGLIEISAIRRRHRELVAEMKRRGYSHASPLPAFRARREGRVDPAVSERELMRRCRDCRERMAREAGGA